MTRIAVLSDIHWRGITRHDEYTKVFETVFKQLREEVRPDYIFGLGDFFHTKTMGITPEVIDKLTWMFKELSSIAPVYAILGNHDGNLTNDNRQDTITPIVSAINSERVTLFKKSGNFIIPDTVLNLCVLSCFDEPGWEDVETDHDLINIALFHGSVRGCQTDSDWIMTHGEVNLSMFKKYDFAMLGDIHKSQFLDQRGHSGPTRELKPWIGYPGSLIQQNYGEDTVKGYHVWDIWTNDDWDVTFMQVANDYQFVTVPWKGDVPSTVKESLRVGGGRLNNKRVRIASDQTVFHLQMKELYDELKNVHKASEVVFKPTKEQLSTSGSDEKAHEKAQSLRNSPDVLCDLYDSFVQKDYKIPLTSTQKTEAKTYIRESLEKVRSQEDDTARDVVWSIKDMEWSNLYRYGEGNRIDFSNISGITGIFGPNKIGKSSVVGSLMYGLFNTTDRGPVKSAYIINKNKNSGFVRVTVNVSGTDYVIERSVAKASKRGGKWDEEKASTKLALYRLDKDGMTEELVSENSESRTDTDKVIRKLIGNSQDFLLTAFSNQGGMTRFIDEGPTQRKAILNRFLDLDIFEKLFKMANEELQVFNAQSSRFQNVNWAEAKSDVESYIADCNMDILTTKATLEDRKARRDKLRTWLQKHGADKQAELRQKIDQVNSVIERTETKISLKEAEANSKEKTWSDLAVSLTAAKAKLASTDATSLQEKAARLQKLSESYSSLRTEKEAEKTKLGHQQKNVKKLELVPCGDTFPTCHYIKDAHSDKKVLEAQEKLVNDLLAASEAMREDFESLQKEKIAEQLRSCQVLEKEIAASEQSLSFAEEVRQHSEEVLRTLRQELFTSTEERTRLLQEIALQEDLGSGMEEEKALGTMIRDGETALQKLYVKLGGYTTKLEQLIRESEDAARIVEEQKVYDSIVQAFSKNGIPAYVLKNKLPEINTELNNILAGIVSFRVFLETEVGSNTLDVFLEDKDSRRVIELASGMEKMIASLAIRVALTSLSSLPKPDIFIQDESFGSLDPANCAKVIELLQTIKNRFKSVLIISHVEEIKEAANNILTICDNGVESSINC